jgi:hypothetical protein
MSIAKQCIEEMISAYTKAQKSYETLTRELSKNDLATQDILHYIELEDFNVILGFAAVKKLKDVRTVRRKIKNEMEPLQILLASLDINLLNSVRNKVARKVDQQSSRVYTPRVIKKIVEEYNEAANG